MKFRFLAAFLLLSVCAQAQDAAHYPAPVQALIKRGLTIQGELPAPDGYRGYLANYGGQPVPIYVPPDGKHALVGSLFDANGKDLTHAALLSAAGAPTLDTGTWDMLGKVTWVAEGAKQPKRIVYVFTDTECPYCHRLWEAVTPRLEKNGVQVRNVMVAVIAPQSEPRAAAVLQANDPGATLGEHERSFGHSTVAPLKHVPEDVRRKLDGNAAMMDALGIAGTPAVIYRDDKGKVRRVDGMPPEELLDVIFGPG
jgi:thiol:disulfide interchange protein DsbG